LALNFLAQQPSKAVVDAPNPHDKAGLLDELLDARIEQAVVRHTQDRTAAFLQGLRTRVMSAASGPRSTMLRVSSASITLQSIAYQTNMNETLRATITISMGSNGFSSLIDDSKAPFCRFAQIQCR
jgi:hypothetical protein